MVPGDGFWQNHRGMQNASEAGAETEISAPPNRTIPPVPAADPSPGRAAPASSAPHQPVEIGGPPGPEPTRFGDWEKKGRCIDF
jgi:hypothetical protein